MTALKLKQYINYSRRKTQLGSFILEGWGGRYHFSVIRLLSCMVKLMLCITLVYNIFLG